MSNNMDMVIELHELWLNNEPDGVRADMSGEDLSYTTLYNCMLRYANMDEVNACWANLAFNDFGLSSMRNAKMFRTNLRHCNLEGCDFRGADLREADLYYCNLDGCDFRGADLREANLAHASLVGAKFDGAMLEGAHLYGAVIADNGGKL